MTAMPTQTTPLTGEGTILGTLQYMAPEQLEGSEADARTDIFALGAVIYEMATGRKAFEGKSQASVISAIMSSEPPALSTVQAMAPLALDHVVKTCLAKDPDARWQTAHDVLVELKWIAGGGGALQVADRAAALRFRKRAWLGWIVAAVLLVTLGILVLITVLGRETARQTHAIRFAVPPPEKTTLSPAAPAVSPDGSLLAFLAVTEGRSIIWVRAIDSLVARPLAGSDLASTMFWSPDSRFLAFIAGGKLKKIELATGSVSTICDANSNSQGDWNDDGTIVFSLSMAGPLYRVQAAGGVPTPLTALDRSRGDFSHSWPQWLPNGQDFLYFVRTGLRETTGIYAASLSSATAASKLIAESYAAGRYASIRGSSRGHLVFLKGDTLMAQSFNHSSLTITGEPMRVAEQVGGLAVEYAGNPGFSISRNGVLAYHSITGPRSQLVWLDRAGTHKGAIAASDVWSHPRLSADGNRVAFERPDPKNAAWNNIWLTDTTRGMTSRYTYNSASEGVPTWSPDSARIVFNSVREGSRNLYWKSAAGGQEELLLKSPESKVSSDWSSDGKFLLFHQGDEREGLWDLWALPFSGDRKPFPIVKSPFNETHGQFSPDGRWIVYVSDESGTPEIYAQPFRPSQVASTMLTERIQITSGGASQPRWRRDGRELFYLDQDSRIIALAIKSEPKFEAGKPQPLFQVRGARGLEDILYDYDVTPDGQRFLFNLSLEGTISPITVTVNWDAALK